MLQFQDLTPDMLTPYIKNYILNHWGRGGVFNNRSPNPQEAEVISAYLSVAKPDYVFINTRAYELWHGKTTS